MRFIETIRAAWNEPELRQRILFIFAMFGVYAIGLHITIPIQGINPERISELLDDNQFLNFIAIMGGGALRRLSIFALGLNPYITASIIMQLVSVAIPSIKKEEMEGGQYARMKRAQRTRFLTIILCALQGWGLLTLLGQALPGIVIGTKIMVVAIWTAGAMMVLWLGEQIQEKGIGQGVSLMIFAGIVVSFPLIGDQAIRQVMDQTRSPIEFAFLVIIFVLMTGIVVYFTQAQRRITIQHMRRNVGTRMVGGTSSYLPIPVNAAGVIPLIFAVTIIYMPAQFASFFRPESVPYDILMQVSYFFSPSPDSYWYQWLTGTLVYALMIFFFTYFWTAIQFNVEEIATRLKQSGAYIPGVRQGKQTEQYLDQVISRITVVGALFLAFVAMVPYWVPTLTGFQGFGIIGGTSILIIVSVVLDLMRQIEANLIMKGYSK